MQPNTTLEQTRTEVKPYKTGVFDDWLTWKACGGLIVDEEDNHIYKMSLTQFCNHFNIARSTANAWRKFTPNLDNLIEKRRNEIAPLARVTMMFNQMFLTGMQSKDLRAAVDAQKAYLGHFGNLQLPTQRVEQDVGNNLIDFLNTARKRHIQEGEVVDGNTGTNT